MYFRSFTCASVFALTFDAVVEGKFQLDFDCVHAKCGLELVECSRDGDNASLTEVKHSYCQSVAACIHQDAVDGLADPMACLDGLDSSNMSPVELKIQTCMQTNKCINDVPETPISKSLPILAITSVKEDCMASQCSSALASCNGDAICKALFECLDLHRDGDAAKCVQHLNRLDKTQQSAMECGWKSKCFSGAYASSDASPATKPATISATTDAAPLNTVPVTPPQVVSLSDAPAVSVPVKSSFVEVKPLSFLSLRTASEAELKAAEVNAERQAKAAEAAWEQSRKNTDSLLAKVHSEIDALNQDLDKTTAQEKSDLALLESNRKKEDAELEATEKKLKELANTKVTLPTSSFLEGFNTNEFLAPLRRAAEKARNFAKQIKEHSFMHSKSSSLIQFQDDKASKALSLAEQALKKLDSDIAAQKKQLADEEEKAKKEQEQAEAQVAAEASNGVSFLQLSTAADLHLAAQKAAEQAKVAEAAWEASRRKTSSLLSKVHGEIDALNQELDNSRAHDKAELSMLEKSRQKEDAELVATEEKLKELANTKIETPVPAASFLQKSTSLDAILAPLRKAAEEAKHFADQMHSHTMFRKQSSSLLQTDVQEDKASKALSLAEDALHKLDQDIAAQKAELAMEEKKAKEDGFTVPTEADSPASFLQTGSTFDPLSPQALADWRDKFELQLQKAREAAGIHTPMHSSLAQLKIKSSFADNEQLREDERRVEQLEQKYNQQMQKLKEDNANLLARAKEEMESARDEEQKVKSQLAQASLLQVGHRYDPAKEEAHIRELERKWIREAQSIVTPPQVVQQDNELQALIEQQRVKEAESEAQLDQMKQKLNRDIEIMNRDLAANSLAARPASFLETASKGPAEAALARAEADLQKLKKQLREETAKLNAMHFDS